MILDRNIVLNYKKIKEIKNNITDKQMIEIDNVCRFYDSKTIKHRLANIYAFIINNVEDHWVGRMKIMTTKLMTDSFSEYALKVRYGNNWMAARDDRYAKVKQSLSDFVKRYGEEEGKKRWELRNSRTKTYGLKYAIERHGEEEGKKRWEITLAAKIQTMQDRKKIKPYRCGLTLPEFQNRHGIEVGYEKWLERGRKNAYIRSKKYYTDTFGKTIGEEKWNEYRLSMNKTSLSSFIKRHGEVDGLLKYQDFLIKSVHSNRFYSKISQELFWLIYNKLDKNIKTLCKFAELNNEYFFYVKQTWADVIMVDFKCGDKIIEFDGVYWHSLEGRKEIDIMRDEYLISKDYKVLRIKENDYRYNKDNSVNECLKFLNNI